MPALSISKQFKLEEIKDLLSYFAIQPELYDDRTYLGRKYLLQRLRDAAARERAFGFAGDWQYNLPRHRQLYRLIEAETAEIKQMKPEILH